MRFRFLAVAQTISTHRTRLPFLYRNMSDSPAALVPPPGSDIPNPNSKSQGVLHVMPH